MKVRLVYWPGYQIINCGVCAGYGRLAVSAATGDGRSTECSACHGTGDWWPRKEQNKEIPANATTRA